MINKEKNIKGILNERVNYELIFDKHIKPYGLKLTNKNGEPLSEYSYIEELLLTCDAYLDIIKNLISNGNDPYQENVKAMLLKQERILQDTIPLLKSAFSNYPCTVKKFMINLEFKESEYSSQGYVHPKIILSLFTDEEKVQTYILENHEGLFKLNYYDKTIDYGRLEDIVETINKKICELFTIHTELNLQKLDLASQSYKDLPFIEITTELFNKINEPELYIEIKHKDKRIIGFR